MPNTSFIKQCSRIVSIIIGTTTLAKGNGPKKSKKGGKKENQFSTLSQVKFHPSHMSAEDFVKAWQRACAHAHVYASANARISNRGYF